jgi:cysteine desulfurase
MAAEIAGREQAQRLAHVSTLQARLWEGLGKAVTRLRWNGPAPGEKRLGTNLSCSVAGVEGEALLLRCDLKGLAVASGSSCLGRSLRVSPVLAALGLEPGWARGSVLMTLGKDNTAEEVEEVLRLFPAVVATLRGMSPAGG